MNDYKTKITFNINLKIKNRLKDVKNKKSKKDISLKLSPIT
jgi:hypothetical protein